MSIKEKRIEEFLKLICDIHNNDIVVDSDLVYSNLINEIQFPNPVNNYFDLLIDKYKNNNKINVINKDTYFLEFKSINQKDNYNIKLYIHLSSTNIHKSIYTIIDYLIKENVQFKAILTYNTRLDNLVIYINNYETSTNLINYIHSTIKDYVLDGNPFMNSIDNIGITYNTSEIYNYVLSSYISTYINTTCNISIDSFYSFLVDMYNSLYIKGNLIEFSFINNIYDLPSQLSSYLIITSLIIANIKEDNNVLLNLLNNKKINLLSNKIINILKNNDKYKITNVQKETLEYIEIKLESIVGMYNTFNIFKYFVMTYNYNCFTKKYNIRNIVHSNNITPNIVSSYVYEKEKELLISSSIETLNKYGYQQLYAALKRALNNDYSGFTNENKLRDNLKEMMYNSDIKLLINKIIMSKGYQLDEVFDNIDFFINIIKK